ncbi:MAG: hypothetical protein ABN482_06310 [Corticimicrobacter sp.]|uniref:S8 family serine peptidase n=1 Tax=Corticimicrobacter sp. TaxID=2678536 RepID=UPI0032DB7E1C
MRIIQIALFAGCALVLSACAQIHPPETLGERAETPECIHYRNMMTAPMPPAAMERLRQACRESGPDIRAHAERTLIIMYDGTRQDSAQQVLAAAEQYGAEVLYQLNVVKAIALRMPEGQDVDQAMAHFRQLPGVLSVERDQVMQVQPVPAGPAS